MQDSIDPAGMTRSDSTASVIIVTHNSASVIRACLDALTTQRYSGRYEVIVVDHESTDGTPDLIRRAFPSLQVLLAPNRGFGAGCNLGARKAAGRFVAFANPDTIADPDWLQEIVRPLAKPKIITTSQIVLMSDQSRINTLGHTPHLSGLGFTRGYGRPAVDGAPQEVPGFSGAAFAMRHEDYHALGGFDEDFFLYVEDTEFSIRARAAGFTLLAVPASRIQHRFPNPTTGGKLFHIERSRQILLRKLFRPRDWVYYAPTLLVVSALSWLAAIRLGRTGLRARREGVREGRMAGLSNRVRRPPRHLSLLVSATIPFRELSSGLLVRVPGALLNILLWASVATWPLRRLGRGRSS